MSLPLPEVDSFRFGKIVLLFARINTNPENDLVDPAQSLARCLRCRPSEMLASPTNSALASHQISSRFLPANFPLSYNAGDPSKDFVPSYYFSIENTQGIEVGQLNFRVGDSDHFRLAAGHVGFAISEEHHGHGYAGDACLAIGPWVAEESGQVVMTTDPENLACIATLNRVGAVYRDEVEVPQGDPHF